jgi:uncharacterized DUF497 family protein
MNVSFEWDRDKATANIRRHGVSFDEAATVFDDPLAVTFNDEDLSSEEIREMIIDHSITNRLLLVCFTERVHDIIRIYSARITTKMERKDYEKNLKR